MDYEDDKDAIFNFLLQLSESNYGNVKELISEINGVGINNIIPLTCQEDECEHKWDYTFEINMSDFFRRGLLNKSIDIVALFDNYRNAEETLNERIASLVVYNQGSLNYDQMWSLTEKGNVKNRKTNIRKNKKCWQSLVYRSN